MLLRILHQSDRHLFYMKILIFCEFSPACICINAPLTMKGLSYCPIVILGWQTVGEYWATFTLLNIIMYKWHKIFSCQFSRNCESSMHDFLKISLLRMLLQKFNVRICCTRIFIYIFCSSVPYFTLLFFRTEASCSRQGGASCRLRERACKKFVQNLLLVLKVCAFFFFIGAQKIYSFIRISSVFISTAFAGVFVVGMYINVQQLHLTCCILI